MAILTATQVTVYAPKISASAATITASGLIPIVQERICLMLNNYFTRSDLYIQATALFNATARSIVLTENNLWNDYGFKAGDDILIYNSYRNDGVMTIESITASTVILTSACSVVDESFGTSDGAVIYFSVIKWPAPVQQVAAQMVYFDIDIRDKVASNIKSQSLGPWSESYTDGEKDFYGYPRKITSQLDIYSIGRVF